MRHSRNRRFTSYFCCTMSAFVPALVWVRKARKKRGPVSTLVGLGRADGLPSDATHCPVQTIEGVAWIHRRRGESYNTEECKLRSDSIGQSKASGSERQGQKRKLESSLAYNLTGFHQCEARILTA